MPFFSVIIPTYNRLNVIVRAIDSVLNQTFQDFELIVIDDGSTDATEKVVNQILDKRLRYLKTENFGVSKARNTAVSKSTGDWVAFLDSDDEWLETKLKEQFDFIIKYPDFEVVHTEEIWIRNGKRVNQMRKHQKMGGDIFDRSLELCLISPSSVVLKKDLFVKVGGFKEDFIVCEDYDLWLRILLNHRVGFIEKPQILKYGGHDDQLSRKYKAMDYYRVKSMDSIYKLANDQQKQTIKDVLLKKCNILISGYLKHENTKNLDEIMAIQNKYKA